MELPSTRIEELTRLIVDELAKRDQTADEATKKTTDFLLKITGTSQVDIAEARLKDPMVKIAAVIAYLDEQSLKS